MIDSKALLEGVSRAICIADGCDPDKEHFRHNGDFLAPIPDGPMWKQYTVMAQAAIDASAPRLARRVIEFEERLTDALHQLQHLQAFPENARNDATNELIELIQAALTIQGEAK